MSEVITFSKIKQAFEKNENIDMALIENYFELKQKSIKEIWLKQVLNNLEKLNFVVFWVLQKDFEKGKELEKKFNDFINEVVECLRKKYCK
ncbi:MAG: hypothetical protein QXL14_03335 [Candidatus Aenigmatarchaeota archaeon]